VVEVGVLDALRRERDRAESQRFIEYWQSLHREGGGAQE
jgi:hypothetical protein